MSNFIFLHLLRKRFHPHLNISRKRQFSVGFPLDEFPQRKWNCRNAGSLREKPPVNFARISPVVPPAASVSIQTLQFTHLTRIQWQLVRKSDFRPHVIQRCPYCDRFDFPFWPLFPDPGTSAGSLLCPAGVPWLSGRERSAEKGTWERVSDSRDYLRGGKTQWTPVKVADRDGGTFSAT